MSDNDQPEYRNLGAETSGVSADTLAALAIGVLLAALVINLAAELMLAVAIIGAIATFVFIGYLALLNHRGR